jgi:hypothetical protein
VNFETKEQSKQWVHTHSPNKLEKFKQTSARRMMAALLWDGKGVLMMEFMQQGTTKTSEVYYETLNKLCRSIQSKSCGMPTSNVVLFHDNEHLHTATHTQALLECFNWELFDHPPYRPDLTPSSYHLFTYLRSWWKVSKCG